MLIVHISKQKKTFFVLFWFFFFFLIYTFIHCSLSFHSSPLRDTLGLPLMKWDLSVGALSKWSKNKKPIDSHNHIRYPVHRPALFAWIPTIRFLLGGGDTLVYHSVVQKWFRLIKRIQFSSSLAISIKFCMPKYEIYPILYESNIYPDPIYFYSQSCVFVWVQMKVLTPVIWLFWFCLMHCVQNIVSPSKPSGTLEKFSNHKLTQTSLHYPPLPPPLLWSFHQLYETCTWNPQLFTHAWLATPTHYW